MREDVERVRSLFCIDLALLLCEIVYKIFCKLCKVPSALIDKIMYWYIIENINIFGETMAKL